MPDSIRPGDMPPGYPAYLAYVDGARSMDAAAVRARFPSAHILTLTVLGGSAVADGCDREPGDLSPAGAAAWLHWRISSGAWRPVLYDSRDDVPATLGQLAAAGVQRAQIRILSAHYGAGEHICGPGTCRASFQADGTQWTDTFPGAGGALIDMSVLSDDFFGVVSKVTDIPLTILGMYTDASGHLYAVGTNKEGVLCESKRTAIGQWSAPYAIAGKVGA